MPTRVTDALAGRFRTELTQLVTARCIREGRSVPALPGGWQQVISDLEFAQTELAKGTGSGLDLTKAGVLQLFATYPSQNATNQVNFDSTTFAPLLKGCKQWTLGNDPANFPVAAALGPGRPFSRAGSH